MANLSHQELHLNIGSSVEQKRPWLVGVSIHRVSESGSFILCFLNVDKIRRPPIAAVNIPRGILMPAKSIVMPWQGSIGLKHNLIPQGISKQPKSLMIKVFTLSSCRICRFLTKALPNDLSFCFLFPLQQVNLANIMPDIRSWGFRGNNKEWGHSRFTASESFRSLK